MKEETLTGLFFFELQLVVFLYFIIETHLYSMTTTITAEEAFFFINNPTSALDLNDTFTLKSQYSQEILVTVASGDWSIVSENARYAEFMVDLPTDFEDKHVNGYYTWALGPYSDIVKIITSPGGDAGKVEYISNNEERDAEVFYRPNY